MYSRWSVDDDDDDYFIVFSLKADDISYLLN